MPTKRTRKTRHRSTATMDSFFLDALIDFMGGWYPARERRSPWSSWEHYLSDWDAIRDEFLASDMWTEQRESGLMPFAEWVLKTYGMNGPSAIDELPVRHSPYPAVMPQPKVLVRYWEYRDAFSRVA